MLQPITQAQKDEAVKLLSDTIGIVTVNPEGEERLLAEFIASYLKATGCAVELQNFAPRRANIIATLKGRSNGKALLLNGHLDTVPFGNTDVWDTPPHLATIRGDTLYGRGASDMKSGLCAALCAFRRLALEGFVPENDIIFAGTGDEETLGLGAQAAVESGLLNHVGRIIIGEPTGNQISVASKGTLWLEFSIHGKTSHGAYPWEGINAVELAYKLFEELKNCIGTAKHPYLSAPTCTLTKIQGGVKVNMVPDRCDMALDIRTVPAILHSELLLRLDALIAQFEQQYSGAKIEYRVLTNRMAAEISPNDALVRELSQTVQAVCGAKPQLTGTGFFSDASIFLREYALPVVLFGPGESSEAHKPNESVSLKSYLTAAQCYYHFLQRQ
ncbi:M20 family metallopeptidase [Hydrogenoanaerobacterium sp.]|uniref:M20 family metallopeptidase n=1 Tax=Hydrogenoanaerobacterium sp. TaxID=2953763 RepID=UPI00289BC512|nr:M20 family metallopeptidase [Hydrogenoanaerobacterium sp.]